MSFPYKNPLTGQLIDGPVSILRNSVQGTNFAVLGVGGAIQVYNLSDLYLSFQGTGQQLNSGNTIPINYTIGTNNTFNPSSITLNSDNISSGRRTLGMLVYVYENDTTYQFNIPNYENLWNAATGQTGTVNIGDYTTTVNSTSQEGRDFIDTWTGSTIEGIDSSRETANWKIYQIQVTGGTYSSGNTTLQLFTNTGGTISNKRRYLYKHPNNWRCYSIFYRRNRSCIYNRTKCISCL
jgi:hypothetical protein